MITEWKGCSRRLQGSDHYFSFAYWTHTLFLQSPSCTVIACLLRYTSFTVSRQGIIINHSIPEKNWNWVKYHLHHHHHSIFSNFYEDRWFGLCRYSRTPDERPPSPSLSYDHISCDGQWFLFVYESLTSDHPSYTTTPMWFWGWSYKRGSTVVLGLFPDNHIPVNVCLVPSIHLSFLQTSFPSLPGTSITINH